MLEFMSLPPTITPVAALSVETVLSLLTERFPLLFPSLLTLVYIYTHTHTHMHTHTHTNTHTHTHFHMGEILLIVQLVS